MGAELALARLKKKVGCRCRPTRGLSFHLAYDRMGFNGLLFMGHVKKQKNTAIAAAHTTCLQCLRPAMQLADEPTA
jgi:hypothetical protein